RELLLFLFSLSVSSAIMCYVCHSDYNNDCWENYEGTEKGCERKNINGERLAAIGCRTLRITHGEERSIIRECAYTGEDVDDKVTRMSNKLYRSYTQCSKSKCNSSSSFFSLFSLGSLLLFALF
ncbi:hypothetical protein PMAYCL1PPCAC_18022, partial [Pristionchus mayeri]